MLSRIGILASLVGLVAALAPAPALAEPAVTGEFPLSQPLNPENKLVEGPDGNIWVTLTGTGAASDVARIDATTLEVDEFNLPGVEEAFGIAAAAGKLWITEGGGNGGNMSPPGVASFEPGNPVGTAQTQVIPEGSVDASIVLGPEGDLWMVTPGDPVHLVRIPTSHPDQFKAFGIAGMENPDDIDVAGSLLVIADSGLGDPVITATPTDPPVVERYPSDDIALGVAGAPGGQIAFSLSPSALGLLTPPGPPALTPSTGTDPRGVTFGPDGAFWFAQHAADTVTRLSLDGKATTLSPGFAPSSGPSQIAAGPNHTLWVTLATSGKLGRISGVGSTAAPPPPPGRTEPQTVLGKRPAGVVRARGARARVSFAFSSPNTGSGFECRLTAFAAGRGKGSFSACRSPKSYRLAPGRYRFEVRAVLAGLADRSPAARGFRVARAVARRR